MQETKKIVKIALITSILLIPLFLTSNIIQSDNNEEKQSDERYTYVKPNGPGTFGYYKLNTPVFREWLNQTIIYKVEKSKDNINWADYKNFKVEKIWNEKTLSEKYTVIVTSDEDAYYRIFTTTDKEQQLVSYNDKSVLSDINENGTMKPNPAKSNDYILNFKDYSIYYNWDDYLKSDIYETSTLSKTISTDVSNKKSFNFQVVSNTKIAKGKTFVLDPVYGSIGDAVIDTWEYDEEEAYVQSKQALLRINETDYYISVARGDTGTDSDGFIRTLHVWNTNGTIHEAVIEKYEYDISDGAYACVAHINNTDKYVVCYRDQGGIPSKIFTISVSELGDIGSIIDTQNLNTADSDRSSDMYIMFFTDNILLIAEYDDTSNDGFLETWWIDADGTINNTQLDYEEFDNSYGGYPTICKVDSDTIALTYIKTASTTGEFELMTYNISSSGLITDTPADTWEYEADAYYMSTITKIGSDKYALTYQDQGYDVNCKTLTISDAGVITKSWIDTLEVIDATDVQNLLTFIVDDPISLTNGVMGCTVRGISSVGPEQDGYIYTWDVSSDGTLGNTIIDSLEFDTTGMIGYANVVYMGANDYYLILHNQPDLDGFISTITIETNLGGEADPITLSNEIPTDGATDVNITINFLYNSSNDIDANGIVDIDDAYNISEHLGETGPPGWIPQDVNEDGDISPSDISTWLYNTGPELAYGIALSVDVNHSINATCNASFYTNASGTWENIGYEALLNNETANCTILNNISWNTKYWWNVSVTDNNGNWTNATYNFTTVAQEHNITFAEPNNTHLTPDPSLGYFTVNTSSLYPTPMTVHFMTNASGTWEEFDEVYSEPEWQWWEEATIHTLTSTNTSWCSFNKNNYWSANCTSFGLWYNETFNFTTDECYQILSYDTLETFGKITYTYPRLGDYRAPTNAHREYDCYIINTEQGDNETIEIKYNNYLKNVEIKNFKLRCLLYPASDPSGWFKLYINGVDCGYATSYGDFSSTPIGQDKSVPSSTGKSFPYWDFSFYFGINPYRYLEWDNINLTISGSVVFEIFKPADKGSAIYDRLALFPRIETRDTITGIPMPPIYGEDAARVMMNDGLLVNARFNTNKAPNGIWDGYAPTLTPDPVYTGFRIYTFVSNTFPQFNWQFYDREWTANAGIIYEFTYKTTKVFNAPIGKKLLPDTYPENNSVLVEINPDLECHIVTNLNNFTRDMNPVFVSVSTNGSGNWTEIWNNTGNETEDFPSIGTFSINSSQYNFSFDTPGTTYYWNVSSRKLTPGAEWSNRTYNFMVVPCIANFTITQISAYTYWFNSTSTGSIDYYTWSFGDNQYAFKRNVKHTFASYANLTVQLCVENATTGYTDCHSESLIVGTAPVVIVTAGPYGMINLDFVIPFLYVIIMLVILMWFMRGLDQFEEDVFE